MRPRGKGNPRLSERILQELGIGSEDFLFYLGSFIPRKGLHWLLKAFALVRERHTETLLVIAGGTGRLYCADLVRQMGIGSNVLMLSYVNDDVVSALLDGAKAFCFPSLYEGLPLVLVEAMQAGLPVVAFGTSGTVDIVRHGYSGLLAPLGDVRTFARFVNKVMDDGTLRHHLTSNAKAEVGDRFSPDTIVEAYERVLSSAIRD